MEHNMIRCIILIKKSESTTEESKDTRDIKKLEPK